MFEAIYGLRATRVYEDRPIPDDVLARILTAATRACSSGNTQPWELVVVVRPRARSMQLQAMLRRRVRRRRRAAGAVARAARSTAPAGPVTGHAAIEHVDVVGAIVFVFWNPDRGIRMQGEYEENPDGTLRATRAIPGGRGSSLFPACQNMMLAAHALGVSVAVHDVLRAVRAEVKELLHVPPRMFLEAAVFLGYGDEPLGKPKPQAARRGRPPERLGRSTRYGGRTEMPS